MHKFVRKIWRYQKNAVPLQPEIIIVNFFFIFLLPKEAATLRNVPPFLLHTYTRACKFRRVSSVQKYVF